MKIATITFVDNDNYVSPIINKNNEDTIVDFDSVYWTPTHVVFEMKDETMIALKADLVHKIVTETVDTD